MYRQSPTSRHHRVRGSKVKHILQISLLLVVCFWLVYQVKHSYDKKKEFDESDDMKTSLQGQLRNDFVKLGRKDPRPLLEGGTVIRNGKHDEVLEDENPAMEIEENNQDDGSVEQIQDKTDTEDDDEENFVDENEAEENDNEDGIRLEHGDKDMDARETREENYRADDVSSAVTQTATTRNGNDTVNMSSAQLENISGQANKSEDGMVLQMEGNKIAKNSSLTNVTNSETNKSTEKGSFQNHTETRGYDEVAKEIREVSLQNVTEHGLELNQEQMHDYSTVDLVNVTTGETNESTEDSSFHNNTKTGGSGDVARDIPDSSLQNVTGEHGSELNQDQIHDSSVFEVGNFTSGATNESTEKGSFQNNTEAQGSDDKVREIHNVSMQNVTEHGLDLNQARVNDSSTLNMGINHSDTNSTGTVETRSAELKSSFTNGEESSESEKSRAVEVGNQTEAFIKKNDGIPVEKLDITKAIDEVLASEMAENQNAEDMQHDLIDSSDSLEETDIHTLPETQNERTNSQRAAAE